MEFFMPLRIATSKKYLTAETRVFKERRKGGDCQTPWKAELLVEI